MVKKIKSNTIDFDKKKMPLLSAMIVLTVISFVAIKSTPNGDNRDIAMACVGVIIFYFSYGNNWIQKPYIFHKNTIIVSIVFFILWLFGYIIYNNNLNILTKRDKIPKPTR